MKKLYKSINLEDFKAQIDQEENINKPVAYDLLEELTFMKETMDELKATVQLHGATYIFKQGEQEYLKENPAMKSYNATVTKYNATLKQLLSLLPEQSDETDKFMDFVTNA
ncbi:hypothetical protein AST00_01845 [Staphylococcus equorum]|uniref:hypothetical protein n=2 Tax=Staphylococcus equorum TaxID=246432 RepID=UPI0008531FCE|nr:hypothetical protein [Staphylococcus equorum]OEK61320.1 hypothetical protein ASS99_09885 [Staphylococcus equorum]OEK71025.1 hypothetical protein AST00_01845 [Staphylococcus equorum]